MSLDDDVPFATQEEREDYIDSLFAQSERIVDTPAFTTPQPCLHEQFQTDILAEFCRLPQLDFSYRRMLANAMLSVHWCTRCGAIRLSTALGTTITEWREPKLALNTSYGV